MTLSDACYSALDPAPTSDAAADDDDVKKDDNRESDIVDVEALRLTSQLHHIHTT